MTDDLYKLLGADGPDDAEPLVGVEDAVWARVSERRERARTGQVRAAVVACAVVVGVTNGGLMLLAPRPAPSEMSIFTVSAALAPLSRLDVRG